MSVSAQMRQTAPCLPRGAHVLFERDPFPQFGWNSFFLMELLYDDSSILVHRPGRMPEAAGSYDAVFDWDGTELRRRSIREITSVSTTPKNIPSK